MFVRVVEQLWKICLTCGSTAPFWGMAHNRCAAPKVWPPLFVPGLSPSANSGLGAILGPIGTPAGLWETPASPEERSSRADTIGANPRNRLQSQHRRLNKNKCLTRNLGGQQHHLSRRLEIGAIRELR